MHFQLQELVRLSRYRISPRNECLEFFSGSAFRLPKIERDGNNLPADGSFSQSRSLHGSEMRMWIASLEAERSSIKELRTRIQPKPHLPALKAFLVRCLAKKVAFRWCYLGGRMHLSGCDMQTTRRSRNWTWRISFSFAFSLPRLELKPSAFCMRPAGGILFGREQCFLPSPCRSSVLLR